MEAFPGMGNDISKGIAFGQKLFNKHSTGNAYSLRDVTERKEKCSPVVSMGKFITFSLRNGNLTPQ